MFLHCLKRLIVWITILILLFFIAATIYVKSYGRSFVVQALNNALHRDILIKDINYIFPFGFSVSHVVIEGGFQIKEATVQFSFNSLNTKRITINELVLIQPIVDMDQRKTNNAQTEPIKPSAVGTPDLESKNVSGKAKSDIQVMIKKIDVKEGQLHFVNTGATPTEDKTDKSTGWMSGELDILLNDVDMQAKDLILPLKPIQTHFRVLGRLQHKNAKIPTSRVEANGWVDLAQKDMSAKINVFENNGDVGLSADVESVKNLMKVNGQFKMQKLPWGNQPAPEDENDAVKNMVLETLSSMGMAINAQFAFETKMDDFKIQNISFAGEIRTSQKNKQSAAQPASAP